MFGTSPSQRCCAGNGATHAAHEGVASHIIQLASCDPLSHDPIIIGLAAVVTLNPPPLAPAYAALTLPQG